MRIKDLRNKSEEELKSYLLQERERLRSLRFDLVAGKVKNIRELRSIKKGIAQVLTILKEKVNLGK